MLSHVEIILLLVTSMVKFNYYSNNNDINCVHIT